MKMKKKKKEEGKRKKHSKRHLFDFGQFNFGHQTVQRLMSLIINAKTVKGNRQPIRNRKSTANCRR